jgi:hypothetical protein
MFKIGDIIKLSHSYKGVIYPYQLTEVEQSYIVLKTNEPLIEIEGLKNNRNLTINSGYFKIDSQLTRKLKLKRICTKLEI